MGTKISAFPSMTALQGTELILGDQSGATGTTTPTAVAAYLAGLTTTPVLASYTRTAAEISAGVTPTNYAYLPGDIRRYGASATNVDNGPPINDALLCNPIVFDGNTSGPIIYPVQTTIRFQAAGQILRGAGMGDSNTAAGSGNTYAPRTTLQWTGASGGKVVSVSNTVTCFSETTLENLAIDGNNLAEYGVEGFDDSLSTISGCWRNQYRSVTVLNCTQGNGTAIYQGNGSGTANAPFANDNIFWGCYLWNCLRGIFGAPSVPNLYSCTIGQMSVAGVHLKGQGSEIKLVGGIFHGNAWDIIADIGATGPIQNVTSLGTWFENSTDGIFEAVGSFSLHMFGCALHTSSSTSMFNFNNQAGQAVIEGWTQSGSGSYSVINTNPDYDYDFTGTGLIPENGYQLRITQGLGLANIDNAKFMITLTNTSSDVTGNGTVAAVMAGGSTTIYDLGTNVDAATGVFTAPASGYYRFTAKVALTGVTTAHDDAQLLLAIAGTDAYTYQMARTNPGAQLVAGTSESDIGAEITVPMAAGDTATLQIEVGGSTQVVGVYFGTPATYFRTFFQGQMA